MALPVGMIDSSMVRPAQPQTANSGKAGSNDPKIRLAYFAETQIARSVTPADIVYTVQQFPFGLQAVVKVICVDGQEFAGEVEAAQKNAEKSAALQALQAYGVDITGCTEWKKTKRPAEAAAQAPQPKKPKGAPPIPGTPGVVTPKGELNTLCSRISRAVMDKKSVVYEAGVVVGGGFQATVTLACLPGIWATQPFAGEVSLKKGDAEQSAATFALAALKADGEMMMKANEPPKARTWTGSKGGKGGKGKGGGKGHQAPPQTQIMQAQQFAHLGGCGFSGGGFSGGGFSGGCGGFTGGAGFGGCGGFSGGGFTGFTAV